MTRTNPKPATCSRCNSDTVAWFKSKRTGKFYLCEVFTDDEGDRVASSRDFHSSYCGNAEAHRIEQERRTGHDSTKREAFENETGISYDTLAQENALDISNLDTLGKVLAIADLARSNAELSRMVSEIWKRQGENTLAAMIDGLLSHRT